MKVKRSDALHVENNLPTTDNNLAVKRNVVVARRVHAAVVGLSCLYLLLLHAIFFKYTECKMNCSLTNVFASRDVL
jgi:fucose 4-O-acetylase-like acetyltransferase